MQSVWVIVTLASWGATAAPVTTVLSVPSMPSGPSAPGALLAMRLAPPRLAIQPAPAAVEQAHELWQTARRGLTGDAHLFDLGQPDQLRLFASGSLLRVDDGLGMMAALTASHPLGETWRLTGHAEIINPLNGDRARWLARLQLRRPSHELGFTARGVGPRLYEADVIQEVAVTARSRVTDDALLVAKASTTFTDLPERRGEVQLIIQF